MQRVATSIGCRQMSTSPVLQISIPAIISSAPFYVRHLILQTPHPPENWPSKVQSVSPLYKSLENRWTGDPKYSHYGVGFSYLTGSGGGNFKTEEYRAYVYPDFVETPLVTLNSIPQLEAFLDSLPEPTISTQPREDIKSHIYVCTHGSRDCRCSLVGGSLYKALQDEVEWKELQSRIEVHEIAHLGGHKYAGNVLLYKSNGVADWYGQLRSEDAAHLIKLAISDKPDPWYLHWRGRLDQTAEETKGKYLDAIASNSPLLKASRRGATRIALGNPITLPFISWDNSKVYTIQGFENESLMEAARRNNLPAILATCGGNAECATCHVFMNGPEIDWLPEMSVDEEEQLEYAMGRKDNSRLSCQIPLSTNLEKWIKAGGTIQLPRY